MNNVSSRVDYNNPVLLQAKLGNTSFPTHPEWNVYNLGSNSSVRLIVNNHMPAAHPWHLHGLILSPPRVMQVITVVQVTISMS